LLVVVIGLDALGVPIDDEHLHRPERIVALTGAPPGTPLRPEHVAAVVREYETRCADVDDSARFGVLINKADAGPSSPGVDALVRALANVELAALVAASQTTGTRLWRLR
jgi:probable selenium-dependent hydroxylase accessory protein YqeC